MGAVLSKILGFLRETTLASQFGATFATDAYFMAMVIPTLLLMGVGPAVTTTLIPVFTDIDRRRGRSAAFSSVSVIINATALIAAGVMVAGMLLARPIVRVVAPGFSGETYSLTVKLTVILFPIAVFSVITHSVTGVLHALGLFTVPALTGIVQNVVIITSILVFGPKYGITAVAVGTSLGSLSTLLIQLPVLYGAGYRHRFVLDWRDRGLRQVGKLMGPIVAGTAASQAGTLVIRTLASRLPEGSITYLNYSQRLVGLPTGVFGTSLVTVLYPTMARLFAEDRSRFMQTFRRSVGVIFFTLAPMAAGLMILASPVVRLAFERGAFTSAATVATAASLTCLSVAIPFTTLTDLTNKAFYSAHNTMTPVAINMSGVAANVVVSLLLVAPGPRGPGDRLGVPADIHVLSGAASSAQESRWGERLQVAGLGGQDAGRSTHHERSGGGGGPAPCQGLLGIRRGAAGAAPGGLGGHRRPGLRGRRSALAKRGAIVRCRHRT